MRVPVQIPAWPVSDTRIASEGRQSVSSRQRRSGRIGSTSESTTPLTLSRQFRTSSCTRRVQAGRDATASAISIMRRNVLLASPCNPVSIG